MSAATSTSPGSPRCDRPCPARARCRGRSPRGASDDVGDLVAERGALERGHPRERPARAGPPRPRLDVGAGALLDVRDGLAGRGAGQRSRGAARAARHSVPIDRRDPPGLQRARSSAVLPMKRRARTRGEGERRARPPRRPPFPLLGREARVAEGAVGGPARERDRKVDSAPRRVGERVRRARRARLGDRGRRAPSPGRSRSPPRSRYRRHARSASLRARRAGRRRGAPTSARPRARLVAPRRAGGEAEGVQVAAVAVDEEHALHVPVGEALDHVRRGSLRTSTARSVSVPAKAR